MAGLDGLVVSNHGGRQKDGACGSFEVLEDIVRAVEQQEPDFLDSGIRCGADVIKELAPGAKAVFVGRPVVYGLGPGVRRVCCMFCAVCLL